MANTLSPSFPKVWSRTMQAILNKRDVYVAITDFAEESNLKVGNIVDRPYRSALVTNALGSEGSYTRQTLTDASDTLTVSTKREVSFYVQDPDKIQSNYNTAKLYAEDAAVALGNFMDGDVLGEYSVAGNVVGNYEMGGGGSASDGIAFTLTTSNVLKVFSLAAMKLNSKNVPLDKRFAVISPQFHQVLVEYLAGKESALGDNTGKNGSIGSFYGFDLYLSNNVCWSARLDIAAIPTAGDTISFTDGTTTATLTWAATLTTTEGSIHMTDSVEHECDNLEDALEAPGTDITEATGAGFTGFTTAAKLKLLEGIQVTDGTTYITLKKEGGSFLRVAETLTNASSVWSLQTQHQLFGQKGAICMVRQKQPDMQMFHRDGYVGSDVVTWILYGIETFTNDTQKLVDVQISSSAF